MVKKESQDNINNKNALVQRSGKTLLGYKATLKALRNGKAKLVFISSNCPSLRKSQIEYYAMLAKVKIFLYQGNNVSLGTLSIYIFISIFCDFYLLFRNGLR